VYPYILLVNCLFLLITLMVYTLYPKLLNHYTRLMRHFVVAMLGAYLLLSTNQQVRLADLSQPFCIASGK